VRDVVPADELLAIDRWALGRTAALQEEVCKAYRDFQFHLIYQAVHNFCVVDLGGFYLDILKDRLYTTGKASRARRSAQTAMHWIGEAMVRWLAPILSFTAEEIWKALPGERAESVFHSVWVHLPELKASAASIDWVALINLRTDVMRELERVRVQGTIGSPLDAQVDVFTTPEHFERFNALGEELRFLFITSEARVQRLPAPAGLVGATDAESVAKLQTSRGVPEDAVAATSAAKSGVWVRVRPTEATKCVRCWQRREDVGAVPAHPELCSRCASNVDGPGEQRRYV